MTKFYLLLQKIKSTSVRKLSIIIFYKVYRLIFSLQERVKVVFGCFSYKPIDFGKLKIVEVEKIRERFDLFYSFCFLGENKIIEAENIFKDKIILFSKEYTFLKNNWLEDPISGKIWDKDVYFEKAKVECDGYGDVKFVMERNKMYHLVTLAQAYVVLQDPKYIYKIENLLKKWILDVPCERSVVNKGALDISFRILNLIQVSLLLYDNEYFRNKVFSLVLGVLVKLERQVRLFSTPRWCKFSTGQNHTIGEMVALLVVQQFLQIFTDKKYDQYFKKEYRYLYNSLENIITNEGVYLEQSANYSRLVAEFLVCLDIFNQSISNEVSLKCYEDKYLHKLLSYINILSYHNKLPNFGDNDGAKVLAAFYSEIYSIDFLSEYYRLNFTNEIKKHLFCKDSGQFVWKSGDEKDMYIFTRCGVHSFLPIGSGSHSHNDILSIILSIKGYDLFVDFGTFFYNSGIDILNNDRTTKHHNTIYFEGEEQASFAGKWTYKTYPIVDAELQYLSKESFVFGGSCKYGVFEHKRILTYECGCLIITDEFISNKKAFCNFILSPNIRIKRNSQKLKFYNDNFYIATLVFDDNVSICIEEIDIHPLYSTTIKTLRILGKIINNKNEITTYLYF